MARKRWRPFPEARAFARSLRLLDRNEWYAFARGDLARRQGRRPDDIPFNPARDYRGAGWCGMRDWLGPPPVEPAVPGHLDFKRARRFARSLGMETAAEWRRWCAGRLPDHPPRPGNVPEDPAAVYPDAWRGWADWLGGQRSPRPGSRFRPFEEARELARSLGLEKVADWRAFCRGERPDLGERPRDVPASPDNVYRHTGWNGYGDWLGTMQLGSRETPHVPFEEARRLARNLHLSRGAEWRAWVRGDMPGLPPRPPAVPTNPQRTYAESGWAGWGDFLGTDGVRRPRKDRRSFLEARAFARNLGLRKERDWRAFCRGERPDLGRRPADIPANPDRDFREHGWTGWRDFLGTVGVRRSRRQVRPFEEARELARSLGLRTAADWRRYRRGLRPDLPPHPEDVPADPESRYRDEGWNGWPDFLGSTRGWRRFVPFTEARRIARRLGLLSYAEWREWTRGDRPDLPPFPGGMPRAPDQVYRRDGWSGWGDFLGTGNLPKTNRKWRWFAGAKVFARSLGLRSRAEWAAWSRGDRPDLPPRPPDIPAWPDRIYASRGWIGWADFLGCPAGEAERGRK